MYIITVGSERGFRGASMTPNTTALFLFDIAEEIIRFNLINIELLKAPNKEEYKKLRWESGFVSWQKISRKLTAEDFSWWEKNVRDLKNMQYSLPEELNRYGSALHNRKFIDITNKLKIVYHALYPKDKSPKSEQKFLENVTLAKAQSAIEKYNLPVIITEDEWQWWVNLGKDKKNYCSKALLENPSYRVDLGQIINYKAGNYLFDDVLYHRLHKLAINNKIITQKRDLANAGDFNKIIVELSKSKAKIAVFDLDNLYHPSYIGQEKYHQIINKLLDFGANQSMFITMSNYKSYGCSQFQLYLGFTFENIRHWPKDFLMYSFLSKIPNHMTDVIDGHVYSKNEMPPKLW